jgi:hypothetical protein
MSAAEDIRRLAREGLSVADIAGQLGIRYQHAYNVLKRCGLLPTAGTGAARGAARRGRRTVTTKPPLLVEELMRGGFKLAGRWVRSEAGNPTIDRPLPKSVGVYAFAKDGIVLYVGVATMGLAKRLHFYAKPGVTQRTSQRLNGIIRTGSLH